MPPFLARQILAILGKNPMNVAIIGMGEIGSALYQVLTDKKNVTVRGWDKNASKVPNQGTLEDAVKNSEVIFLCVPSWTLRGALISIASLVQEGTGVVCLSKGIERETCKTTDELLREFLPGKDIGVLGGPMIAEEIVAKHHAAGVLGTTSSTLRKAVKQLFRKTTVHIATTTDIRGVALCGVLKNAYAVILGMGEGMNLGQNAKGAFMAGIIGEMQRGVKLLGGKQRTVLGLAGLGDLFATGTSPHSRNHAVGVALANNVDGELASEGLMSLHCLENIFAGQEASCPLLFFLINLKRKRVEASALPSYLSSIKV